MLEDVSAASSLIPFAVALACYKRIKEQCLPLLLFTILAVVAELIYSAFSAWQLPNRHIAYVYLPLEYLLLSFAINKLTVNKLPNLSWGLVPILTVILYELFVRDSNAVSNAFAVRAIVAVLLVAVALSGFRDLLANPDPEGLTGNALFWLCANVLFYYMGNLMLFAFLSVNSARYAGVQYQLWVIHSILNIIFNLLLILPLVCLKKNSRFP